MAGLVQRDVLESPRPWEFFLASFNIVVPFGWPVIDDKQSPPQKMLSSTPLMISTGPVNAAMGDAGEMLPVVSSSPIVYGCFVLSE
jgi:hypothetical protein